MRYNLSPAEQHVLTHRMFKQHRTQIEANVLEAYSDRLISVFGGAEAITVFVDATSHALADVPDVIPGAALRAYEAELRNILESEIKQAIEGRMSAKRKAFADHLRAIASQ